MDCPRCGTPLVAYALDGRQALGCEACGYAGIEVDHHVERREGETWAEALRRFERERTREETDDPEPAIVRVDE
ncbi:hypothetical protein [Halosegnis sp.]|uniref:hypothetical protein n=1 Tax=Halosegnis sp. TaxID=2864959 RepID=UPI0035D4CE71